MSWQRHVFGVAVCAGNASNQGQAARYYHLRSLRPSSIHPSHDKGIDPSSIHPSHDKVIDPSSISRSVNPSTIRKNQEIIT
ncbi:hypothetical protein O181_050724 [Austropuccinia psidii MF-1]|uniref:Uncharacterized protein n=1 Tax=Austropuccinia psidii MF-1 TaxID=1389203 RepID=A0A9Q3DXA5_9BASI|nr:hypothetical protein [Austropuccinia psidii MF-1]